MIRAALSAARFHDFDADVTISAFPAPGTARYGVCSAPARGAWISSETTTTPNLSASRATAASSSTVWMVPLGLCGEHKRNTFGRCSTKAASSPARSSLSSTRGTSTSRRPVVVTTWRNGG